MQVQTPVKSIFNVEIESAPSKAINARVARICLLDHLPPVLTVHFTTHYGSPGWIVVQDIVAAAPKWLSFEFTRAALMSLAAAFDLRDSERLQLSPEVLANLPVEIAEWDDEIKAYNKTHFEFRYRSLFLISLNLREPESHWYDNIGGIANAIFDLTNSIPRGSPAIPGNFLRPDGQLVGWNYNASTGALMYHVRDEGSWTITLEKAELNNGRGEEFTEIYRPFFRKSSHDSSAAPAEVEWLKTREVVVIKNHHNDRTPLSFRQLLSSLPHLLKSKRERHAASSKELRWENLIYPILPKKSAQTPPVVLKAHEALVLALRREANHIDLYGKLRNLNHALFLIERRGDHTSTSHDNDLGVLSSQMMATLLQELEDTESKQAALSLLLHEYNVAREEGLRLVGVETIRAKLASLGFEVNL